MTADKEDAEDELPLEEIHRQLEKAIEGLTGRPKHCARNAFRCLKRSWLTRTIDPEMAVFRAITAEEEAATALMFALKHRRYPDSEQLFPKRHDHKAAWTPFVEAVGQMLNDSRIPQPTVRLRANGTPRVDIAISATAINVPGATEGQEVRPDEPLNLVIFTGNAQGAQAVATFDDQLNAWAAARGKADIRAWIDDAANLRNLVLYAQDGGIPSANDPRPFILERRRRATVLLFLTIAVLQADEPQALAAQALRAFLKLLRYIDAVGFDFESLTQGGDIQIVTTLDPVGGQHVTRIVPQLRHFTFTS